jgi:hypothetical protein
MTEEKKKWTWLGTIVEVEGGPLGDHEEDDGERWRIPESVKGRYRTAQNNPDPFKKKQGFLAFAGECVALAEEFKEQDDIAAYWLVIHHQASGMSQAGFPDYANTLNSLVFRETERLLVKAEGGSQLHRDLLVPHNKSKAGLVENHPAFDRFDSQQELAQFMITHGWADAPGRAKRAVEHRDCDLTLQGKIDLLKASLEVPHPKEWQVGQARELLERLQAEQAEADQA